jgi:hypothetical protein
VTGGAEAVLFGIGFSGELGFADFSSGPTVDRTSCADTKAVPRKMTAAQVMTRSMGLLRSETAYRSLVKTAPGGGSRKPHKMGAATRPLNYGNNSGATSDR